MMNFVTCILSQENNTSGGMGKTVVWVSPDTDTDLPPAKPKVYRGPFVHISPSMPASVAMRSLSCFFCYIPGLQCWWGPRSFLTPSATNPFPSSRTSGVPSRKPALTLHSPLFTGLSLHWAPGFENLNAVLSISSPWELVRNSNYLARE